MRVGRLIKVGLGALLGLAAALVGRGQGNADLNAGDPAPTFSLAGSDGQTHTLAEHQGRSAVVIAWFPKAFTGG